MENLINIVGQIRLMIFRPNWSNTSTK